MKTIHLTRPLVVFALLGASTSLMAAEVRIEPTLLSTAGGTTVTATITGGQFYSELNPPRDIRIRLTHEGLVLTNQVEPLTIAPTRMTFRSPPLEAGYYGFLIRVQNDRWEWEEVYRSGDRYFRASTEQSTSLVYLSFTDNRPGGEHLSSFLPTTTKEASGSISGAVPIPVSVNDGDAVLNYQWTKDFPRDGEDECGIKFELDLMLNGSASFNFRIPYRLTFDFPTKVYPGQTIWFRAKTFSYLGGDSLSVTHTLDYSTYNRLWINAPYDWVPPVDNKFLQNPDTLRVWGSLPIAPFTAKSYDSESVSWSGEQYIRATWNCIGGRREFSTIGRSVTDYPGEWHAIKTTQTDSVPFWITAGEAIEFAEGSGNTVVMLVATALDLAGVALWQDWSLNVLSQPEIYLFHPYLYEFKWTVPADTPEGSNKHLRVTSSFPFEVNLRPTYAYRFGGWLDVDLPFIDQQRIFDFEIPADIYSALGANELHEGKAEFSFEAEVEVVSESSWLLEHTGNPIPQQAVAWGNFTPAQATAEKQRLSRLMAPLPTLLPIVSSSATNTLPTQPESEFGLMLASEPSLGGTITRNPLPVDGGYASNTVVTLTANPACGYRFAGWSGAISGSSNPASITMNDSLPTELSQVTANFAPTAPVITDRTGDQTAALGEDVRMWVRTCGVMPVGYQWTFNGTNIAGATMYRLYLANVQLTNAGSYAVVVTNLSGSVTSSPAVLTVSADQAVIAQWNFNSAAPDGSTATGTLYPYRGNGWASYAGDTRASASGFSGGSPTDLALSDNSAWATTRYPLQGIPWNNKSGGVGFEVSTAGRQNIVIEWDQQVTANASKYWRLRYWSGTGWFEAPLTSAMNGSSVWETKRVDLGMPELLGFQIVAEFESTAIGGGNNQYVSLGGLIVPYATNGISRFDMVTVYGAPLTPPDISTEPTNQTVLAGQSATFSVGADGAQPLTRLPLFGVG